MREDRNLLGAFTAALMLALCGCEQAAPPPPTPTPLPPPETNASERALLNRGLQQASTNLRGEAIATEAFSAFTEAGDVVCAKILIIKPSSEEDGRLISSPTSVLLIRPTDDARWEKRCAMKIKDINLPSVAEQVQEARARMAPQSKSHQFKG